MPLEFVGGYTEFHIFADASMKAYGAVAYLRCISLKGHVTCRLLMSISHMSPAKKTVTLVRLELQAARCACDIYVILCRELGLRAVPVFLWLDSMVVLGYINNESRRFHTFVANRVSHIREYTIPNSWWKVASKENPSDLLTRPMLFSQEKWLAFWQNGLL